MTEEYKGLNGCYWSNNEEDGCVVNWGRRSFTCPNLQGVKYKKKYYSISSPEFLSAFNGEDIDYNQLFWDCSYEQGKS